jgi:hypothetical protein
MDLSLSGFRNGPVVWREVRFFDPSVGAFGTIWTVPLLPNSFFGNVVQTAPALYAAP